MKKAIIVDIDGTLANIEHRRHHVTGDKKDWKSFNEAMKNDTHNQWCLDLLDGIYRYHRKWEILFVSGREEKYRKLTVQSLGLDEYELFMRPTGDFRADHFIKLEIYEKYIKPFFDIQFCIDDRKQVVDMWRAQGLICLQCAEGNF